MDILVSAIVGDLISRSASFVINKYYQKQPGIDKILQRLHQVLLRIDIVVEEAEARHITNQGMLRQLRMLRQGMYRGHYMLDGFRYQGSHEEMEVRHSASALIKFSPAKRLRFSCNREPVLFGTSNDIQEELQLMVETLEDNMAGMKEFLLFLESYPRVLRQPYGAYLLLDNCMFGRQMERRRVLNFLLQTEAHSRTPDFAVLSIVGPIRVGKSTLVEHVCKDESVRDRFSMILLFPENSLKDEGVINLRGNINGLVKHQNCASQKMLLIIVEIGEDIDEGTWRSLKSSAIRMAPCGSKIIITSRSEKIVSLGTTEALRVDYLPPEAYWHFFKSLAFGSTSHDEHPKLATMAMEIASEQRQCFTGAHLIAGLLRDNFNTQFWTTVLECVRAYKQKHLHLYDKHPNLRLRDDEPVYYWRLARSSRYFMICDYHKSASTDEIPKIRVQDILLGRGTLPQGKFKALAWRSRLPPYYNYTISCMEQAPQTTVGRKKRVSQEE